MLSQSIVRSALATLILFLSSVRFGLSCRTFQVNRLHQRLDLALSALLCIVVALLAGLSWSEVHIAWIETVAGLTTFLLSLQGVSDITIHGSNNNPFALI